MWTIYKKEMKSYMHSMLPYLYAAVILAVSSIYFCAYCFSYGISDYATYVIQNLTILFLIIVPILTMRLVAEERKQKTDQLLLTSPIRIIDVILGKYLAVLSVFFFSIIVFLFHAGILSRFGDISWKTVLTGCFGYFLLGASLLAIGVFVSSISENSFVAAGISFGVSLLVILLPNLTNMVPQRARYTYLFAAIVIICLAAFFYKQTNNIKIAAGVLVAGACVEGGCAHFFPDVFDNGLAKIINWCSVLDRFTDFCTGVLNVSSIVYYLSFILVFIMLSVFTIEQRRWK